MSTGKKSNVWMHFDQETQAKCKNPNPNPNCKNLISIHRGLENSISKIVSACLQKVNPQHFILR